MTCSKVNRDGKSVIECPWPQGQKFNEEEAYALMEGPYSLAIGMTWPPSVYVGVEEKVADPALYPVERTCFYGLRIGIQNKYENKHENGQHSLNGFVGAEISLLNTNYESDFRGVQIGVLGNYVMGAMQGVQAGVFFNNKGGIFSSGMDLGLNSYELFQGARVALFNFTEGGDTVGLEVGAVNMNTSNNPPRYFVGAQLAFLNFDNSFLTGFQAGLMNTTHQLNSGLQLGLLNSAAAGSGKGLHLGALNLINDSMTLLGSVD